MRIFFHAMWHATLFWLSILFPGWWCFALLKAAQRNPWWMVLLPLTLYAWGRWMWELLRIIFVDCEKARNPRGWAPTKVGGHQKTPQVGSK